MDLLFKNYLPNRQRQEDIPPFTMTVKQICKGSPSILEELVL